jgi:hypothetical protein
MHCIDGTGYSGVADNSVPTRSGPCFSRSQFLAAGGRIVVNYPVFCKAVILATPDVWGASIFNSVAKAVTISYDPGVLLTQMSNLRNESALLQQSGEHRTAGLHCCFKCCVR